MSDTDELITRFPMPRTDPLAQPPGYALLNEAPPRRLDWLFGDAPWLVTRHADVRTVLGSPNMSSDSENPNLPRVTPLPPGPSRLSFMRMDDPDHGRLRRMLTPEFTAHRLQSLRPQIQAVVDDLLEGVEKHGQPADLVAAFGSPLASRVICELLGVPASDQDFFYEHIEVISSGAASPERVGHAFGQLSGYIDRLTTAKEQEPGEDILSRVAAQYLPTGELTHDELAAMAKLIIFVGHEITARMISLAVVALLRHPDQLAVLREQPELIRSAVDELLRYVTVLNCGLARVATEDIEVGGQLIAKGEGIICILAAANHDESVFPNAGTLDIRRSTSQHLAFGYGIHQCMGRPLALAELELGLTSLLARFPGLRLAVDFSELTFLHELSYGVKELPVAW